MCTPNTSSAHTFIEAISGVLELSPGNVAITILVIVLPVLVHVLVNVAVLSVLDPFLQLRLSHKTVPIPVDSIYDFSAEGRFKNKEA